MASSSAPSSPVKHESFSPALFAFTVIASLAGLFALLRFAAPVVWDGQWAAPLWKGVVAFLAISFVNCIMEFFFHRYVLHLPAIPFLRRLYRQHTLHHALTRIGRKQGRDGRGVLFVENKFPIVEPEQGEASFFPWYSLAVFAGVLTPLLAALQWLFPSFPWFVAGFLALVSSLILYETLHAINHWSFEKWDKAISHPRWGRFWRPVYGFHLRHHAVIDCNESISGFFGLPLADWIFGTFMLPTTIYADGEEWAAEKFTSPRPRRFIQRLDSWTDAIVSRRRAASAAPAPSGEELLSGASMARTYTRGEQIANWATHGLGLGLSIAALTLLIVFASLHGDAWHVVSFTVFGLTMMLLYGASTLYHTRKGERAKKFFLKFDHAAIFLLIAGTYTPFLLTSLRGPWGWSLFGVIWGLCGAGAVFHLIFGPRFRAMATFAYIFLGWLILIAFKPLLASVPPGGLWLLLAGGLCYSVGVIFYKWHRLRYHHAVWHTFVLGGTTCHFLAVLLFLLPRG